MLLYSPVPGEERLELAGVEYLIPMSLSSEAPAGFTGDADVWRNDMEGFGLWELNVWLWLREAHCFSLAKRGVSTVTRFRARPMRCSAISHPIVL